LLDRKRELEKMTADKSNNNNIYQQAGASGKNNEDGSDNNETMLGEFTDQSCWVQLVVGRKPVKAADLAASSKGSVFAYVHNKDNNDMNLDKF
jgi:flagellar motor switch/type III secretory pathway protein FliN